MSNGNPRTNYPAPICGLLSPAAYPHPVTEFRVIETHISWVVLTGPFAYKIKKPRNLGFLDFTTLRSRKECCTAELSLNRRYAPQIYLSVEPICGPPEQPHIGGAGDAIEYAVKMAQFDPSQVLDRLVLMEKNLPPTFWDELAAVIAEFHKIANHSPPSDRYGSAEEIGEAAAWNFPPLQTYWASNTPRSVILDRLREWSEIELKRLRETFRERKDSGRVRECHGDLHLGNIVRLDQHPVPFDGIEFDPALRWIDVMSEIAFPVMDLEVRGFQSAALRLLNRYLELTGDYSGLRLLDYYRAYRALVRAKVGILTEREKPAGCPGEATPAPRAYLDYAAELTRTRRPLLIIMHGLSGSGKSFVAAEIAQRLPAIRIRSDVERKRIAGLTALEKAAVEARDRIYGERATESTYQRLGEIAATVLEASFSVVVDATFLDLSHRDQFRMIASQIGRDFRIIHCKAPLEVLQKRVLTRQAEGLDPSEAGLEVLEMQRLRAMPLHERERVALIEWDTVLDRPWESLMESLRA